MFDVKKLDQADECWSHWRPDSEERDVPPLPGSEPETDRTGISDSEFCGAPVSGAARRERYQRIAVQLSELLAKTNSPAAHRATAVALLHHKMPGVSWTGFYLLHDGELVVDAYQGPLACLVLEPHVGVCWAAIDRDQTQVVADVHTFEGHIPCDSRSRSEIVVAIHDADGNPIGVLDVDSHLPDQFDEVDAEGYEMIVEMLECTWNGNPWNSTPDGA